MADWRFGEIDNTTAPGYFRLKYSPDGNFLAARNRANVVEVRDCSTWKLICEIGGFKKDINGMDFSSDSKFLALASDASEHVKVFEIATGKKTLDIDCHPILIRFDQKDNSVVVVSASGKNDDKKKRLVGDRTEVMKYDLQSGMFSGSDNLNVESKYLTALSNTGRFALVGQRTTREIKLTKLYDAANDTSVILNGPPDTPRRAVFSPDESWIAAIYNRQLSIRLWNRHDPSTLKFELKGHTQTVKSLTFSHDSRFLVSTGWDRKVVIWDLLTREPIETLRGHSEQVVAAAFSPTKPQLATGASGLNDSTVIVWDLQQALFPKQPKSVSPQEFEKAWRALGSTDPRTALEHLNNLKHSADATFNQVKRKLAQRISISRDKISKWISQLDAKTFAEREHATKQLLATKGNAERMLLEKLESGASTEAEFRIRKILKQPSSRPKINVAQLRRIRRGIMLLELISKQPKYFQASKELLKSLSQHHPHKDICVEAYSTLERISFRVDHNEQPNQPDERASSHLP